MESNANISPFDELHIFSLMLEDDEILEREFIMYYPLTSFAINYFDEDLGYKHVWPNGKTEVPHDFITFDHKCYYKEESDIQDA